jgi:hypothetical protein
MNALTEMTGSNENGYRILRIRIRNAGKKEGNFLEKALEVYEGVMSFSSMSLP